MELRTPSYIGVGSEGRYERGRLVLTASAIDRMEQAQAASGSGIGINDQRG